VVDVVVVVVVIVVVVTICCSFGNNTQHWSMLLELLAVLPEEVSSSHLYSSTLLLSISYHSLRAC